MQHKISIRIKMDIKNEPYGLSPRVNYSIEWPSIVGEDSDNFCGQRDAA
jgi:hypothetical protein